MNLFCPVRTGINLGFAGDPHRLSHESQNFGFFVCIERTNHRLATSRSNAAFMTEGLEVSHLEGTL
jgi:hypothetical protein